MHHIYTYKGNSIRYSDQGTGKISLFLHGYLESLEVFSDFTRLLAQKSRVITLDLPGHGHSSLVDGQCSMEIMAEAINALTDYLQIEKITLFGHSMGGYAALTFAERYPHKLEGLCLLHSTPLADTEKKRKNRQREIELIKRGKKAVICKTSIPSTFSPTNRELFANEIERIIEIAQQTKDEAIIASLQAMMRRPCQTEMLSRLNINKSCIIGRQDQFTLFEKAMQIAHQTGMKPYVLDNSAHMGFIEEREQCLKHVLEIIYNI